MTNEGGVCHCEEAKPTWQSATVRYSLFTIHCSLNIKTEAGASVFSYYGLTTFCGVPRRKARRFSAAMWCRRRRVSFGAHAICGVK